MLILSRKIQETIMIGDDIQIVVIGFDGKCVRLGIQAPREIPVHRTEFYIKIKLQELKKINDQVYPPETNEKVW